jgi:hypothetical protein
MQISSLFVFPQARRPVARGGKGGRQGFFHPTLLENKVPQSKYAITMKNEVFDFNDFYELSLPFATRPYILGIQNDEDIPKPSQIFYGEVLPPHPLEFRAIAGGQPTDFLYTDETIIICVSQKVIDILIGNKCTGWSTYPVICYDQNNSLLPGYYGFSVKSYAGEIDNSKSTIITKPVVPGYTKMAHFYIGSYFVETKWDGSHIFRIQNAVTVARKEVVQEFKRNKVTNVRFTRLTETVTIETVVKFRKGAGQKD